MRKLFKWLLLSLVVLAIGAGIVLYNPGIIKGPLERFISEKAGYPITLEGKLRIKPGRSIEVSANGIRVAAPKWAHDENLATLGHLYLALNTASIFEDTLVIESLKIDKLQLNLEIRADGIGNWSRAKMAGPTAKDRKWAENGHPPVVLNDLQASDATLHYQNGRTGREHLFNITSLEHHQQADGMLHTTLKGRFNDRPVEYTGSSGPYINLLRGRDISYTAEGHFGELALKGHALIDSLKEPRKPRFNLDLEGSDIDEITAMLHVGDLGSGGFSLHADGAMTDGTYHARVSGEIGDVSLNFSAQSTDITKRDAFDLKLAAKGPNLNTLTRMFGIDKWPNQPFSLNGDVHRAGSVLNIPALDMTIGSTSLALDGQLNKFPGLDNARVNLTAKGDEIADFHKLLSLTGPARGPFELTGVLDVSPQGVELLHVDLNNSLGQAAVSGTLGPAPAYIGSQFDVQINGPDANSVLSGFGADILPPQPFQLKAKVEWVKGGLRLEKGAVLNIQNEHLQADGLIGFKHGAQGTDLAFQAHGDHLAQVLGRYGDAIGVPDKPFELDGRVRIVEGGLQLSQTALTLDDNRLKADGAIRFNRRISGSSLDFSLDGKDLTSLGDFRTVGGALDVFVKGQAYQAAGHLSVGENGWKFEKVKGRIGNTAIHFDLLVSNAQNLVGSDIQVSAQGPNINELLIRTGNPALPASAFESSAHIKLAAHELHIENFIFNNDHVMAKINLDTGWPLSSGKDVRFDGDLSGDDIRVLLPPVDFFAANKAPFKINAAGRLWDQQLDIDHSNVSIGNLQANLKGHLSDQAGDDTAPPLSLRVTSPDISKVGKIDGRELPAMAFDLKGDFKGDTRQFTLHGFSTTLGNSHLSGDLDVSLQGSRPDIKLVATSKHIDIRPFIVTDHGVEKPDAKDQDRLIPDLPIPIEAMRSADLNIQLDIDELVYTSDDLANMKIRATLKSGTLNVREVSFEAPHGTLNAALTVAPADNGTAEAKFDLETRDFIYNYSGLSAKQLEKVPAFDIDLHVSGNGAGLREVAGNLNGSLYLGSKGGETNNIDLGLLNKFLFDEIFELILPKANPIRNSHFTCIAAIADIADGVLKTNPALALNSEKIILIAKGKLDLNTEKLNVNFNATPTNFLKVSATEVFQPYLVITGTLAKPVVALDPGKAVLAGGAAIASMGTTVLAKGLYDRLSHAVPVCEDMLKEDPVKQ